jgi:thiol-disulfide isomerase/thioredoxin
VTLVVFWAVWCPACLLELPSLDRLSAAFAGADLAVLAIAQQSGDARTVQGFLRRRGLTHLAALVDEERRLGLALAQRLFPTAVLFDRAGCEVGRLVGPVDWESPEATALIRRHMAGNPTPPSRTDNRETASCRS